MTATARGLCESRGRPPQVKSCFSIVSLNNNNHCRYYYLYKQPVLSKVPNKPRGLCGRKVAFNLNYTNISFVYFSVKGRSLAK